VSERQVHFCANARFKYQTVGPASFHEEVQGTTSTSPSLCAIAGSDQGKVCTCWNNFKPSWNQIVAAGSAVDPAFKAALAAEQSQIDQLNKACDGFATSPSFMLVVAAALSMTLFTMRNPLE
jgi:hypothetical protein